MQVDFKIVDCNLAQGNVEFKRDKPFIPIGVGFYEQSQIDVHTMLLNGANPNSFKDVCQKVWNISNGEARKRILILELKD